MRTFAIAAACCGLALAAGTQGATAKPLSTAASRAAQAADAANWRAVDPENTLVIDTNKGRIIVELVPEVAPNHVARLKALARKKTYDGLVFFRVIDMFMAQTGDPKNTGDGSTGEPNLKAEFTFRRGRDMAFTPVAHRSGVDEGFIKSLPVVTQSDAYMAMTSDGKAASWGTYCPGVVGMARDDDPDSANSQFFLMRQSYPSLDKRYTAFGRVISGEEVVRQIKTGEPVVGPDRMISVRVLADIPLAERPWVSVLDTKGPMFQSLLAQTRMARGADFSVCDLTLPARVVTAAPPPVLPAQPAAPPSRRNPHG